MHKIAVIGSGYVGLVAGACFTDLGMEVICVDKDKAKIDNLNNGRIPIYEFGLDEMVSRALANGNLQFTVDIQKAVEGSDVIFIAVSTPPMEDGSADIKHVLQVAGDIGHYMNGYKVIVDKSTVPVGTGQRVKNTVSQALKERGVDYPFDVVSNPEFLREGSAIHDFMGPDRIVLGLESQRAKNIMLEVYERFKENGVPILITSIETAELIKYASNAFLAIKITYINEIAHLCEKVGADVSQVAAGIGMDKRIGPDFLRPGPGYGGSCFPKDTKALAKIGDDHGVPLTLVHHTISANERLKWRMVDKILEAMKDLKNKNIGVLGITFKPHTDDMREAPSLIILEELAKKGAKLQIYDPHGEKEGKWRLESIKSSIIFCAQEYEAAKKADVLVLLTDWPQFKALDLNKIRRNMRGHYFFDFRNIFERREMEEKGFMYYGIGR